MNNEYLNKKIKDPTKKVKDYSHPCMHPEHNPPMFRYFSPGEYEHTCPSCGHITRFTVPLITM